MKCNFLLVLLFFITANSISQDDSTDFNFYTSAPYLENPEDSLQYPSDIYSGYTIAFQVNDVASIQKVHIEFGFLGSSNYIIHKSCTKQYLIDQGFLNENNVTISLGNQQKANYQIHIMLERSDKSYSQVFTRTLLL